MSLITTHVLDTAAGGPVEGIRVLLEYREKPEQPCSIISQGKTDADGRLHCRFPGDQPPKPGLYSLRFDTSKVSPFFPEVLIQFNVADVEQHYHVPLLLTHFGYTTYRGS
jgi:5-hydroxyisourate hydrolase